MEQPIEKKPIRERSVDQLWEDTKEFFHDLIDITDGMDEEGTIKNIHNNKLMKGANAWLLMCSIMVASLGLDLNSPAVIIGAMLISPLMSPILGIGLGIGVNDRDTLVISLQHFGIAIAIALVTSFIYFKLTPFGEVTEEIMSRTSPTLLDGLVAIFGGLAGVISITRLDKSNAIPGVAIATALMPPLCVAGFGLANGQWSFFLNAFYLFFLNSSFIAITTYIIIRILRFPYKVYLNRRERNRNRAYIIVFSLIILIPAITILMNTVKKVQERQVVDTYLKTKIASNETILSEWTFAEKDSRGQRDSLQLILKIIGDPLSRDYIDKCDKELEALVGKKVDILTYQSEEIPLEDIKKLQNQFTGLQGEFKQKLQEIRDQENSQINALNARIDTLEKNQISGVFEEVEALFPQIKEIAIDEDMQKSNFKNTENIPVALVRWKANMSPAMQNTESDRLEKFIRLRYKLDTLLLVNY